MQPHTGATLLVINYLVGRVKFVPKSFAGKTFYVKSEIKDGVSHRLLRVKYHLVKTVRCNPHLRELSLEVGKDWACFLKVRYDYNFEKFEFLEHRHSNVREKFELHRDSHLKASPSFTGSYRGDKNKVDHSIKGTVISDTHMIFKDTYLEYPRSRNTLIRQYDMKFI